MKALLAAALASCGLEDTPPDFRVGDRVEVFLHGHPVRRDEFEKAIQVIHDAAVRVCDPLVFESAWCAAVHFRDEPFLCTNHGMDETAPTYHGCQPYPPQCIFEVGWKPNLADTALVDEIGHFVWTTCKGRSGEHPLYHGGVAYDADFYAWTQGIRNQIRRAQ